MNDKYFLDKGFEKNGNDIYVYKNFISQKNLNLVNPILDKIRIDSNYDQDHPATLYDKKITKPIEELRFLPEDLELLFGKEYNVPKNMTVNVMTVGDFWGQHFDSHDFIPIRELSASLKEEDEYKIVQDSHYGIVAYFNVPEKGGELYYVNQKISYTPHPGDLVVHSAEEHCMHRVNQIWEGYRYSYSNNLAVDLRIPKDIE
jgi:hypothetical protein